MIRSIIIFEYLCRAINNSNICTDPSDSALAHQKYKKLMYMTPSSKECLIPCNQIDINIRREGFGHIPINETVPVMSVLAVQRWIKKSEEKLIYTELSLLAEIGGYVGIFLGYSMLNVADNLYNFVNTKGNKV